MLLSEVLSSVMGIAVLIMSLSQVRRPQAFCDQDETGFLIDAPGFPATPGHTGSDQCRVQRQQ